MASLRASALEDLARAARAWTVWWRWTIPSRSPVNGRVVASKGERGNDEEEDDDGDDEEEADLYVVAAKADSSAAMS